MERTESSEREDTTTSDHVSWMLELTIKPGELDNLETLIDEMVEPTRFVVYGNPSDEVQEALSAFGVINLAPVAGFAR